MKKHLPLIILAVILLGWAVFINSLSNQFIFAPSRDIQPVDPALREVNIPVQFGHALNGLYMPPKAGMPVILFFHGNSYNVTHFQDFAKYTPNTATAFYCLITAATAKRRGPLPNKKCMRTAKAHCAIC